MPPSRQFRGAFTALVTPFTPAGAIDEAAFRALVRRQIDACIDGLVLAASTGESPTLEPEERRVARRHGGRDRLGAASRGAASGSSPTPARTTPRPRSAPLAARPSSARTRPCAWRRTTTSRTSE